MKIIILVFLFLTVFVLPLAFAEQQEMIWESNAPLPTPRAYFGYTSTDEKIYVIGGFDENESALDVVEVYNTKTNSWATLAPLLEPLHHTAAAAYEGKLYVAGGTHDQQPSFLGLHFREKVRAESLFFIYDIEKNEWKRGPDIPTPRLGLTSQAINGTVYVIGGANHFPRSIFDTEHEWYSVNEEYDIESGAWQTMAPMPTPRDHVQSTVMDGKIFVIGGRQTTLKNTVSSNEVYDPSTDSWTILDPMPTLRSGMTMSSLNGTIFVYGGLAKDGSKLDVVEQYIPDEGWITHEQLPMPLDGPGSVTIDNKIYLIGGLSEHGLIPINVSFYDPNVIPEFSSEVFLVFIVAVILVIYLRFVPRSKILALK